MADNTHLETFMRWASQVAPAKKFALVYGGHGDPWRGLYSNRIGERTDSRNYKSPQLLGKALKRFPENNGGHGLDLLAAYGCGLGSADMVCGIGGRVQYLVARPGYQRAEVNYGLGAAIKWLADAPSVDPAALAEVLRVNADRWGMTWKQMEPTQTYRVDEVGSLVNVLKELSQEVRLGTESDLALIRTILAGLGGKDSSSLVSFLRQISAKGESSFANFYIPRKADQCLSCIRAMTVGSTDYDILAYLPKRWSAFNASYACTEFSRSTEWAPMLCRVLEWRFMQEEQDLGNQATAASALPTTYNQRAIVKNVIETAQDVDFVRMAATAGQVLYSDFCAPEDLEVRPRLEVFAPDQTTLLASSEGNPRATITALLLPQTGDYYLRLSRNPASPAGLTNAVDTVLNVVVGDAAQLRPSIAVSTNKLAFGLLNGLLANQGILVVSNAGASRLYVTNVLVTGTTGVEVAFSGGSRSAEIEPGDSEDLYVAILPGTGFRSATVAIESSDPVRPRVMIPLTASLISQPMLCSPSLVPGVGFKAILVGEPGRSVVLQTSSDLRDWRSLTNLVIQDTVSPVSHFTRTNDPRRFYRVIYP